jgi:hypothetical protein
MAEIHAQPQVGSPGETMYQAELAEKNPCSLVMQGTDASLTSGHGHLPVVGGDGSRLPPVAKSGLSISSQRMGARDDDIA